MSYKEKYKSYHDIPDELVPWNDFTFETKGEIRIDKEDDCTYPYMLFAMVFRPKKGTNLYKLSKIMGKKIKSKNGKSIWAIPFTVPFDKKETNGYCSVYPNRFLSSLEAKEGLATEELINSIKFNIYNYGDEAFKISNSK